MNKKNKQHQFFHKGGILYEEKEYGDVFESETYQMLILCRYVATKYLNYFFTFKKYFIIYL